MDLTSRNVDGIGISVCGVDNVGVGGVGSIGVGKIGDGNSCVGNIAVDIGGGGEARGGVTERLNDVGTMGLTENDSETSDPQQPEIIVNWRRIVLLIVAITVHNIPEGKEE